VPPEEGDGAAGLVIRIQEQGERLLTDACGLGNDARTLLALSGSENEAFAELFGLLDFLRQDGSSARERVRVRNGELSSMGCRSQPPPPIESTSSTGALKSSRPKS
jgi:hypothetical protein